MSPAARIGVLALQGGFAVHLRALESLGADAREVRTTGDLDGVDALVLPGGESTAITKALRREGLDGALRERVEDGMALLGTCAGAIVCDREHLGLIDVVCERNAYGRQLHSFEADVTIEGAGPEPLRAVFIRAPVLTDCGPGVRVLAELDGDPVVVRQGPVLAASFHPELTADTRLHALFMAVVSEALRADPAAASRRSRGADVMPAQQATHAAVGNRRDPDPAHASTVPRTDPRQESR